MKNIITMKDLLELIIDNNPPKEIIVKGESESNKYYLFTTNGTIEYSRNRFMSCMTLDWNYFIEQGKLDTQVEILQEENQMKEMVYQKDKKREVLYSGTYKGYDFYIMNLGTHPTAYVDVSNNQLLNEKYYDKINIDVHGGLTYSADHLVTDTKLIIGWFIGWDYGHYDDYAGYEIKLPKEMRTNGKKWTTKEIFEDVKSIIEQCINYKEENDDEWEDIEKLQYNKKNIYNPITKSYNTLNSKEKNIFIPIINQLIKNQKYLKEKLDSKDESKL